MKKVIPIILSDSSDEISECLIKWLRDIEVLNRDYTKKSGSLIIEWVED